MSTVGGRSLVSNYCEWSGAHRAYVPPTTVPTKLRRRHLSEFCYGPGVDGTGHRRHPEDSIGLRGSVGVWCVTRPHPWSFEGSRSLVDEVLKGNTMETSASGTLSTGDGSFTDKIPSPGYQFLKKMCTQS